MDKWLPSRKLVLFFGASAIVLVGLFVVKNKTGVLFYKPIDFNTKNLLIKKISNNDSDQDGLKDWEENLWKTDPNNPDTDGDGTNDNEEIIQNRDPLVAGPNDLLEKENINLKISNILNQSLTTTDLVGRELMGGYLSLKKSGSLNEDSQKILIDSIVEKGLSKNEIKEYFLNDIYVGEVNLDEYSKNLLNLLKENSEMENDLIVFKRALDNENETELKKLEKSIKAYNNIKLGMLSMKVPKEIAENHINLINSFEKITKNIESMTIVFKDPIGALININEYTKNEENIMNEFDKIWKYLRGKGINLN